MAQRTADRDRPLDPHARPPHEAELALEVVDAEHGRAVGRTLAAYAAARAWRAGVRTMLVSVDPENVRVHTWLATLGARALLDDADRFAVPAQDLCVSAGATPQNGASRA